MFKLFVSTGICEMRACVMDYKSSHIKCMYFNIEGHFISLWSGCFD